MKHTILRNCANLSYMAKMYVKEEKEVTKYLFFKVGSIIFLDKNNAAFFLHLVFEKRKEKSGISTRGFWLETYWNVNPSEKHLLNLTVFLWCLFSIYKFRLKSLNIFQSLGKLLNFSFHVASFGPIIG